MSAFVGLTVYASVRVTSRAGSSTIASSWGTHVFASGEGCDYPRWCLPHPLPSAGACGGSDCPKRRMEALPMASETLSRSISPAFAPLVLGFMRHHIELAYDVEVLANHPRSGRQAIRMTVRLKQVGAC
jgi:hypothetical protein